MSNKKKKKVVEEDSNIETYYFDNMPAAELFWSLKDKTKYTVHEPLKVRGGLMGGYVLKLRKYPEYDTSKPTYEMLDEIFSRSLWMEEKVDKILEFILKDKKIENLNRDRLMWYIESIYLIKDESKEHIINFILNPNYNEIEKDIKEMAGYGSPLGPEKLINCPSCGNDITIYRTCPSCGTHNKDSLEDISMTNSMKRYR